MDYFILIYGLFTPIHSRHVNIWSVHAHSRHVNIWSVHAHSRHVNRALYNVDIESIHSRHVTEHCIM
jgi:hypothetical protein